MPSQKPPLLVALRSKYTRALTHENLYQLFPVQPNTQESDAEPVTGGRPGTPVMEYRS
jgi:hypothetical protein